MQQYQKLALAAVAAATALSGCASRQPGSTSVVVVPQTQATPAAQASTTMRGGTVVEVQSRGMTASSSSPGMSSSGGATDAGASSAGQMVIIQFADGKREIFHVAAGGQEFQVGDQVTVNTTQGTALITRPGM